MSTKRELHSLKEIWRNRVVFYRRIIRLSWAFWAFWDLTFSVRQQNVFILVHNSPEYSTKYGKANREKYNHDLVQIVGSPAMTVILGISNFFGVKISIQNPCIFKKGCYFEFHAPKNPSHKGNWALLGSGHISRHRVQSVEHAQGQGNQ